jgi:hypothetical protein
MVKVAVGRSGNKLVSEIETGKRVHRRHLEGVVQSKIREQARDTLREHGLADSRRAVEEHVMPTRRGYFAGPLGLDLTHHGSSQPKSTANPAASSSNGLEAPRHRFRRSAR